MTSLDIILRVNPQGRLSRDPAMHLLLGLIRQGQSAARALNRCRLPVHPHPLQDATYAPPPPGPAVVGLEARRGGLLQALFAEEGRRRLALRPLRRLSVGQPLGRTLKHALGRLLVPPVQRADFAEHLELEQELVLAGLLQGLPRQAREDHQHNLGVELRRRHLPVRHGHEHGVKVRVRVRVALPPRGDVRPQVYLLVQRRSLVDQLPDPRQVLVKVVGLGLGALGERPDLGDGCVPLGLIFHLDGRPISRRAEDEPESLQMPGCTTSPNEVAEDSVFQILPEQSLHESVEVFGVYEVRCILELAGKGDAAQDARVVVHARGGAARLDLGRVGNPFLGSLEEYPHKVPYGSPQRLDGRDQGLVRGVVGLRLGRGRRRLDYDLVHLVLPAARFRLRGRVEVAASLGWGVAAFGLALLLKLLVCPGQQLASLLGLGLQPPALLLLAAQLRLELLDERPDLVVGLLGLAQVGPALLLDALLPLVPLPVALGQVRLAHLPELRPDGVLAQLPLELELGHLLLEPALLRHDLELRRLLRRPPHPDLLLLLEPDLRLQLRDLLEQRHPLRLEILPRLFELLLARHQLLGQLLLLTLTAHSAAAAATTADAGTRRGLLCEWVLQDEAGGVGGRPGAP
ncbi:hypothetical protein PpBr36_02488 [Pyricularia pennisetigena]|uniref:hypothetical protein n=1 Tax=Pyricularia pennisetigena TaxID=1578925 RepID=UPI00114DDAAC|nr:hypothetical protein PpBr36_02488 [Pyricularia pennisetigena]TLS30508.1 hypothetical protein PpBr36_02488 [Pyricularia pennisetigena]